MSEFSFALIKALAAFVILIVFTLLFMASIPYQPGAFVGFLSPFIAGFAINQILSVKRRG